MTEPAELLRLAPASPEAEMAVLGGLLAHPAALDVVRAILEDHHFADDRHGRIYAAICAMADAGQQANPFTLKAWAEREQAMDELGGATYLARLAASSITLVAVRNHARYIVDMYRRRRLIAAAQFAMDRAEKVDPTQSPAGLAKELENDLHAIFDGGSDAAIEPLPYTVVSSLAGIQPAPRSWCVPDWIPDHAMTLLAGDGGVGKSIAALMLHIACSVGIPWIGLPVDPRPSLYFSAEDPFDEVHRRVFEIAAALGVDIASLTNFAFCSFADDDAVLMAPGDRFPVVLRPTEVWHRLGLACDALGARLVTIDTAADTFGGDEIKRREVRAFISLMNRHARAIDGAVLMTAHPSLDGLRSGSGTSGSTGWNNSTRSRAYLTNPSAAAKGDGDEQPPDPDARLLTRKKANFARIGESIELRWQGGILIPTGTPAGIDRMAINATADRVFRDLLRSTYAMGSWVSPNPAARNFAPSMFSRHPEREGLGKAALEGAMHRLMRNGSIRTEDYGYPSDRRTRIAPA